MSNVKKKVEKRRLGGRAKASQTQIYHKPFSSKQNANAIDMTGSAKFKSVPIIDVTKENVAVMGPLVRGAIIGADFIAIDCVSFYLIFYLKLVT